MLLWGKGNDPTEGNYPKKEQSAFNAAFSIFEEVGFSVWTGVSRLPGVQPSFDLFAEAGLETMPPRNEPHMGWYMAGGGGAGIRFYWLTLEVVALYPFINGESNSYYKFETDDPGNYYFFRGPYKDHGTFTIVGQGTLSYHF